MARQDGFGLVWFEKSGFPFCLMDGWMESGNMGRASKQRGGREWKQNRIDGNGAGIDGPVGLVGGDADGE